MTGSLATSRSGSSQSPVDASAVAPVPASTAGATLASAPGQPLGSHVHVNSLASPHESGSVVHAPPFAVKHQPQPRTGVHVPHVVYALHVDVYPTLPPAP